MTYPRSSVGVTHRAQPRSTNQMLRPRSLTHGCESTVKRTNQRVNLVRARMDANPMRIHTSA